METGEEVIEPEAGLPHVRLLVLEPEQQDPNVIEESGAVDLSCEVFGL